MTGKTLIIILAKFTLETRNKPRVYDLVEEYLDQATHLFLDSLEGEAESNDGYNVHFFKSYQGESSRG